MPLVDDFAELFAGRTDAYGTDTGGCWRPSEHLPAVSVMAQHLSGERPTGVYPMVAKRPDPDASDAEIGWYVHWMVVDLDIKSESKPSGTYKDEQECHLAATNLQRVASKLGLTVWIERTRSNARHCWLYFQEWTSAVTARHVGLVLCKVSGATDKEIFPKQESLTDGQLGNYCRLPLPGALKNEYGIGSTQVIIYESQAVYWLATFVREALAKRASTADLERVAALYQPPKPKHVFTPQHTPYYGNPQLNALGRHAIEYGPANGDRSSSMAYIAHQAHDSGMAPHDCFELLRNIPWSKYTGRPDEDKRLLELVERAYANG